MGRPSTSAGSYLPEPAPIPWASPWATSTGTATRTGSPPNSGTSNATVILSDGTGGTSIDTSHAVGTSPRSVAVGNFDADARADAAVANYGSNSLTLLTSLQPGPPATPPITAGKRKCKKKKIKKAAAAAEKRRKKKKKKKS